MNRKLVQLAALAMVALIIAACSNASGDTGSSGGNHTAVTFIAPTATAPTATAPAATAPADTVSSAGDTTGNTTGNTTAAAHEQAVKFAECMRANGVSAFPDPDASGSFTIDEIANGSSVDTNSAAWQKAIDACKDLQPPGFTGHKRSPQEQENALKFAQCIRDNGVPDFPDPAIDGPIIDTNRIPSAAGKGGMSLLHAAMDKCRGIIADQLRGQ